MKKTQLTLSARLQLEKGKDCGQAGCCRCYSDSSLLTSLEHHLLTEDEKSGWFQRSVWTSPTQQLRLHITHRHLDRRAKPTAS